MKKTTLQDMRDILVDSKEGSDRHFWGVVTRQNRTASGDVTSYEVALGGNEGTMTCRKLAGADVGDTVMVTLTKTGMAVVTGTVDGDKDAEAAMTTAEAAQGAVDTLSETVDTLADDVDSIEGLVGDGDETGITITTQYYLSTSNTTQTGGTWSDTLPTYVSGRYYWTKTITTYADGSEVESTPVLDVAAQISAETNAVATATDQHFWSDSSGAYVTKSNKSLSSGYAMKVTTNGLLQTYNGNNLMSLTSSGLSFYQSDGSTAIAMYSSAGCYLYGNGTLGAAITSSGATIYGGSALYRTEMTSSGLAIYTGGTKRVSIEAGAYSDSGSIYLGSNGQAYLSGGSFGVSLIGPDSYTGFHVRNVNYNWDIQINGYHDVDVYASNYFSVNADNVWLKGASSGTFDVSLGNTFIISNNGTRIQFPVAKGDAIGTANTENLRINTTGGGIGIAGSSKRLKENISYTIDDELNPQNLYGLKLAQFNYKEKYDPTRQKQIGFIAEDVYDVFPIAANIGADGRVIDWNDRIMIPSMLALIQELNDRVTALERRN